MKRAIADLRLSLKFIIKETIIPKLMTNTGLSVENEFYSKLSKRYSLILSSNFFLLNNAGPA
jgi:hypothetical protein